MSAPSTGADVLIQELEDFTPPALRPKARDLCATVMQRWREAGCVTAVRINPLAGDGMADLSQVMAAKPDIIALPKVDDSDQIEQLAAHVAYLEATHSIKSGSTELLPNIESAGGLVRLQSIIGESSRVHAALVASEDMAADLNAERGRDGLELAYVRQRFLVECTAAGIMAIDCPYTWTDLEGVRAETRYARRLGYRAKCTVAADHPAIINEVLTPSEAELAEARRIVSAFDTAQEQGVGRAELDGNLIEVPTYTTAKRLMARAAELAGETKSTE